MEDKINHPKHYNNSPSHCTCGRRIECIDITRHMGFNLGNAVKYIWRYADKNGLEDLKKAAWYLNDLIELRESITGMFKSDSDKVKVDEVIVTGCIPI